MTGITSAIESLVASIVGIFQSILGTIVALGQSVLAVGATFVTSLLQLARSLLDFVLSNILVFGVLGAAFVAYVALQQRQPGQGAPIKIGGGKRGGKKLQ
ncbi:MAG: hypothetical protein M1824_003877 [Vezdaea acicularis]|nr:MAG: hypothetical protein M1824_003877 [Vezdaea acicularis]